MTGKERVYTALAHQEPDRVLVLEYIFEHGVIEQVLGRSSFWRGHFKEVQAYWEGRRDEVVESQKPLQQIDEETWRDWQGNVYRYSSLTEDLMLMAPPSYPSPFGIEERMLRLAEDPEGIREERIRGAKATRAIIDELFSSRHSGSGAPGGTKGYLRL